VLVSKFALCIDTVIKSERYSEARDYFLLLIVTMMSVAANLPQELSILSGVDRKDLLAGLLIVVTIALVRYSRFVLVAAVFILAVGANLSQDIVEILNVDCRIFMCSLIAIVLLSLANRIIKLPTGLDKPEEFFNESGSVALFGAISRRCAGLFAR
jgi:hypothetical protein